MIIIGNDTSFNEASDRLCRFALASLECTYANGRLDLSQAAFDQVVSDVLHLLNNAMESIRHRANEIRPLGIRGQIPNQDDVFDYLEGDLAYIDLTAINLSKRFPQSNNRKIRLIRDWLSNEFFPTYIQNAVNILQGEQ